MTQFTDTSIDQLWAADQWTYIRKNVGEWHGTFMQFSPEAVCTSKTPSVLTLDEDRPGQHMTLVLKRMPEGKPEHTTERELGYPGAVPYICFFPTGAFSQGAMQRRPWSSFGAEFSLLWDHRRLRLVQLYNGTANGDHCLDYVTLIPESRSPAKASSPEETFGERLSLDMILGTWAGKSLYLSATMETPQVGQSHWQAQRIGDEICLSGDTGADESQRFTPVAPHRWQAVDEPVQLWLLPGGVSCTVYPQLPRRHAGRLELCWYLAPHQRQRIVRDYDAEGNWLGTALMLERRG